MRYNQMSEPPPPPQPLPQPGPRAQRLHQVYAASLARTLDRLSYDNIAPCFPTISRRAGPVLRQVQSQMVQKLRDKSEREFRGILEARGVVAGLNTLEEVVASAAAAEEQRKKKKKSSRGAEDPPPTPPHLLPPEDILNAHLSPHLASHQSLLNARLQTTQAQNALLADHIRQQRREMEDLLGLLDKAVEDVRGANAVLGGLVDELAAEARTVDADLRGLHDVDG